MCFAPQPRDIFGYLTFKKWSEHGAFCSFWLANVFRATAACDFWISDLQNVVRKYGVSRILIYKSLSCHSGMRFLDVGTSKIAPRLRYFVDLFCKCASCHSRVPFLDKPLKNWSDRVVFCAFWLENVFRATAACHYFHLSVEHTRRFSEATFRTSGTTNHWKNTTIRDFANILRGSIFFLLTLLA